MSAGKAARERTIKHEEDLRRVRAVRDEEHGALEPMLRELACVARASPARLAQKAACLDKFRAAVLAVFPATTVTPFGSFCTPALCLGSSDVDVVINFPDDEWDGLVSQAAAGATSSTLVAPSKLARMDALRRCEAALLSAGFESLGLVLSAQVPLCRVSFKPPAAAAAAAAAAEEEEEEEEEDDDSVQPIEFDVSIQSTSGIANTAQALSLVSDLSRDLITATDARAAESVLWDLLLVIKVWARGKGLADAREGGVSSNCLFVMGLASLQIQAQSNKGGDRFKQPAAAASASAAAGLAAGVAAGAGITSSSPPAADSKLVSLLFGFFTSFSPAKFNVKERVVSCRTARFVAKKKKVEGSDSFWKRGAPCLAVEDLNDENHNCAAFVTEAGTAALQDCAAEAADMLETDALGFVNYLGCEGKRV
jgi:DNA polymerase sigma